MRKSTKALAVVFALIMLMCGFSTVSFAASNKPAATKKITTSAAVTQIKLTWSKVSKATGYRVYQSVNGEWKVVLKSTKNNTYTVKNLKPATSYKFAVKTYKKVGSKYYWSNYKTVSAKTTAVPNTSSLKATAGENAKVTLKWSKVSNATGYVVYVYKNGKWTKLKSLTENTYTATGLNQKTTYKFRVKTYRKISGKNYYSSGKDVSATTKALTVGSVTDVKATPGSNSVTLKWTSSGNVTGYRVYQYDAETGKYTALVTTTKKSYVAEGLSSSSDYTFTVRPYAKSGSSTVWGKNFKVKASTSIGAPYSINGTIAGGFATVTWTRVTDADGYNVYLYDEDSESYELVMEETTDNTYTIDVPENTMHKMALRAYNLTDEGIYEWSSYKYFTVGGVSKYRNIFASGEYSFSANIEGILTDVYVKNGSCQMSTDVELIEGVDSSCKIIYNKKSDKTLALIDIEGLGGFYTTKVKELVGEELDMSELTSYGLRFCGDTIASDITISEVSYDGKMLIRESYTNSQGSTVSFYFDNGELVRHDVVTSSGGVDSFTLSNVSGTVADSKISVKVPVSYINIDIFM